MFRCRLPCSLGLASPLAPIRSQQRRGSRTALSVPIVGPDADPVAQAWATLSLASAHAGSWTLASGSGVCAYCSSSSSAFFSAALRRRKGQVRVHGVFKKSSLDNLPISRIKSYLILRYFLSILEYVFERLSAGSSKTPRDNRVVLVSILRNRSRFEKINCPLLLKRTTAVRENEKHGQSKVMETWYYIP